MPKRKADIFAGKGSFADKLRQRREAIESGEYGASPQRPNEKTTTSPYLRVEKQEKPKR